jgi:hydroxymethylbilane synthase
MRIGTRGSALARRQAALIEEALAAAYPEIGTEVVIIRTQGDVITGVPLSKVGGKGIFVKEIEDALLRGVIDLAVHSMKDVPSELPAGLHIGAVTEREDPRDVMVSRTARGLADLPDGARIGTSSLRRTAQLLAHNHHWRVVSIRGNLDTRMRKLETERLDAIVVAAAGMHRMGFRERIVEYIDPDVLLPPMGQGALAIECREDSDINDLIAFLHHPESGLAVSGERAFLRRLAGGCQVPIGVYGEETDGRLTLRGMVSSLDGSEVFRGRLQGDNPDAVGTELAEELLVQGAGEVLREIYGDTREG